MANLFKLMGEIAISTSNAENEINKTIDAAKNAETPFRAAMDKFGKIAEAAGKAVVAGLALASAAITSLAKESLALSGEVEQGIGGAEAVFGEYAEKIQGHAKNAFKTMGLSVSQYYSTANKMGSLFQGTGASVEESFDMTTAAMQRAADVAAIMGIDINWAMESVAGMAKGNYTMMDNLGVAMNDTTLEAYALEKGIEGTWSEMLTSQKIGIAYQMFMEKTAKYAGQYAKENETYVGSFSTAKAAFKNFLSGELTMEEAWPSIENAGKIAIDRLTKLLPHLIGGLQTLVNSLLPHLDDIVSTLSPAFSKLVISLISTLANPETLEAIVNVFSAIVKNVLETLGLGFLIPDSGKVATVQSAISGAVNSVLTQTQTTYDSAGNEVTLFSPMPEEIKNVAIQNRINEGKEWRNFLKSIPLLGNLVLDPEDYIRELPAFTPNTESNESYGPYLHELGIPAANANQINNLSAKMDTIAGLLSQIAANGNKPIVLNTGALVGGLLPAINTGLGTIVNRRGNG